MAVKQVIFSKYPYRITLSIFGYGAEPESV